MNIDLRGKRALVCGSTQGIGRAAAMEMAALGAEVTLLARDAGRLGAVCTELPTPHEQHHGTLAADFADLAEVRRQVQGSLDPARPFHILVNNTGGPPGGLAIDADPEQFVTWFRTHLASNQVLVQALVPGMKKAAYGRIVNIISTSVKQPIPGLGVSNTVRGAVASWAKTLSAELGPSGITVNNVLPGYTETERLRSLIHARATKAGKTDQQIADEMRASIPAGRFGRPDEIGAAIAFLASPAAAYINGINLPVDGGRLGTL